MRIRALRSLNTVSPCAPVFSMGEAETKPAQGSEARRRLSFAQEMARRRRHEDQVGHKLGWLSGDDAHT
jgi:hypothetical protein